MPHHHHPEHRLVDRDETARRIGERRKKGLAWFGIVLVVVIAAFVGIAVWAGGKDVPVQVNPAVPTQVNPVVPPQDRPDEPSTPPVGHVCPVWGCGTPSWLKPFWRHHVRHHQRHHRVERHGDRPHTRQPDLPQHRVSPPDQGTCLVPTISGYAGDGSVIAIPNPDCNNYCSNS